MRWILALAALLSASANEVAAQGKGKGVRLWNLTTATISEFQLSPVGKNDWGPNQTLNDKDKESITTSAFASRAWSRGAMTPRSAIAARSTASSETSKSRLTPCFQSRTRISRIATSSSHFRRYQPADHTASPEAFRLLPGYSQRHLTAVHFGCSPTHFAM
jgi:hypothetical protein